MFFGKKNKNLRKCENCGSKSEDNFSFCPHCGNSFIDPEQEIKDFGMLGRSDSVSNGQMPFQNQGFGITDRLISSVFESLMKSLDKQFQQQFKEFEKDFNKPEIKTFPNGVRIKIAGPFAQKPKQKPQASKNRAISEKQIEKISSLPRAQAKTSVKRLGDRIVYELNTPGVISPEDIFISKLESGYEVKAIGNKKIYVNSIPINLPIKKYSVLNDKLSLEFHTE